jgi:hypothetical protein
VALGPLPFIYASQSWDEMEESRMQGVMAIHTPLGIILGPDRIRSPFDNVVEDLVQKGGVLYESLRDCMQPQWQNRLFEILIVDDPDLDARATDHAGRDRICIFRGAVERI